MIEVVVRNLLSNAIKFTPCGGEVAATAVSHDDATATITISDTGVGLSPAHREKVFAIGVQSSTLGTADEPGSGLGLILCREMVEQNGGKIWLESEPGRGTAVSFTIPLPPSSQPAPSASS
jgi:signal transduction histidine kinase